MTGFNGCERDDGRDDVRRVSVCVCVRDLDGLSALALKPKGPPTSDLNTSL